MEVKWLIEDYEGDGTLDPLIAEVKEQGMQCEVINYIPFMGGKYDHYSNDELVIFYGSLNLAAQLQREKPWIPGPICNFKQLCCLTYYSHWGQYLFNKDYIMLPLLEISRRREELYKQFGIDDCIFMRPDSGAKTFYGNVYPKEELDSELKLMSGYAGLPMDEILAVISSPKPISREWRVVVAHQYGVVAASQYKKNGKLDEEEGCPPEVIKIAESIAMEEWQPDSMYTVDVCESNGEFYFLEVNSFSCSGLYKCDPKPIVEIASKVALEEWEDYQEP
jgi:hypothetical protein